MWILLVFIKLDVLWAFQGCGLLCVIDFGKFSAFITSNIFFSFLSCYSHYASVTPFAVVPRSWIFSFGFFSSSRSFFFFLHFFLGSFCLHIFKLTDCFLSHAQSTNEPIKGILHFCDNMFLLVSILFFGSFFCLEISSLCTTDSFFFILHTYTFLVISIIKQYQTYRKTLSTIRSPFFPELLGGKLLSWWPLLPNTYIENTTIKIRN